MRIPKDMQALLVAASGVLRRPQWRVLADALDAYVGGGTPLTAEQQRAIRQLVKLHQKAGGDE
jgi:hypothetical protein